MLFRWLGLVSASDPTLCLVFQKAVTPPAQQTAARTNKLPAAQDDARSDLLKAIRDGQWQRPPGRRGGRNSNGSDFELLPPVSELVSFTISFR